MQLIEAEIVAVEKKPLARCETYIVAYPFPSDKGFALTGTLTFDVTPYRTPEQALVQAQEFASQRIGSVILHVPGGAA